MSDKKLKTFDVSLSFSFQTKYDDFMDSDLNFDNVSIIFDSDRQRGLINLSGDPIRSKHFYISADIKDLVFNCSSRSKTIFSSKDFFNYFLTTEGLEPRGDFVFCYRPVIGSDFFFGAKEVINGLQKKNENELESKKFSKRSRSKKS